MGSSEWIAPPVVLAIPVFVTLLDAMQRLAGRHYFVWRWPPAARGFATASLLLAAYVLSSGDHRVFVYFQF
jgi:hypothetical protein